ncbi:MAG: hypothetical protein QGI83_13380 [Candidatus Latescibacteria bacterium]|nr:hypothetical protein [Candidatus Latescibacterota bacterium]
MSDPSQLPDLLSDGSIVLDYASLRYNPCDDLIFPSVIRADGQMASPLAKYHMYYAPHDSPGGIYLAIADALEGPWREYDHNPLVENVWQPHYRVGHVSSPHAIHNSEASELFLYYHGDNDTTHLATSTDGVTFEYEGVACDQARFQAATGISSRVFYARVSRHESPSERGPYVMTFMASFFEPKSEDEPDMHGLYAAWSHDGRTWKVEPQPILRQSDLGPSEYVCAPYLFSWNGRHHIYYHRDFSGTVIPGKGVTDTYRIEVDADLRPIGPQELVCRRQAFGDDNLRASDPCPFVEGDTLYLFSSVGARLNQKIGLTKAPAAQALG